MTRTEGEHELVLGNKQLLSAFFVVVMLLGVFFTMGYFVGKNTATGFNAGTSAASGGSRPDPAGKAVDSESPPSPPPDSTAAAVDPNASTAQSPVPSSETPAPATTPPVASKPSDEHAQAEEASGDTMAQPTAEQKYLQVSAVRRPDADNMVKVLRERGFPALLGESSKQGLYRVLVGPFKTNGELGRTKTELKAKGFESIVAK
jgi:cell division septation protein DedD